MHAPALSLAFPSAVLALLMAVAAPSRAAPGPNAPQVLFAVTNSQSMDGTTSGAIMTGSGTVSGGNASLTASSSPVRYTVPPGFTPPVDPGTGGSAPYTAACNGQLCDNGPSRLNLAKGAIARLLDRYPDQMFFGLQTFSTGSPSLMTTWLYLMSGPGGFTFSTAPGANTVTNPCFNYASASSNVASACKAIDNLYSASIGSYPYLVIELSSDDPRVNDVLYSSGLPSLFMATGGATPSDPYAKYSLADYNAGRVSTTYSKFSSNFTAPGMVFTPTNAGYVAYAPQVLHVQRGFAYGTGSVNATGSSTVVPMGGSRTAFATALAPETNSARTTEVKAVAGQSPMGGLLQGARSYLGGLAKGACQKQYVVLLTDGLPTLDAAAKPWPPLGSLSGDRWGLTARFDADGNLQSTNDLPLQQTIDAIKALKAAGVKVYVIGLGAGVDPSVNVKAAESLQAMAVAGGSGRYFPAGDADALNAAMDAIAADIMNDTSVAAPTQPPTVADGTAYAYLLRNSAASVGGTVTAYPVDAAGAMSSTPAWEAGALMTAVQRAAQLMSTAADGRIQPLSSIDAAAWGLTSPTSCVPDVAALVAFTVDPNVVRSGCSYLAGRKPGSLLGGFSPGTGSRHAGPPRSARWLGASGYSAFVRSTSARPPMLLFTNNDGFLYAVHARTGAMLWGWTPRGLLPARQSFAGFESRHTMDGGFAVVDAPGPSGWASYVIGSAQGGAEHFVLQLDASGQPVRAVFDEVVAGASAPGDRPGVPGTQPSRQPPQVVQSGGGLFYVYVVNAGSPVASTLVEVDVATGVATRAPLPFVLSSAIVVDALSRRVWAGSAAGEVWAGTLSGQAAVDVDLTRLGALVNPSDSTTPVKPVLYVGATEWQGMPLVWAASAQQLTVFGVGPQGWMPRWATTPTGGHVHDLSKPGFSASATVVALTSSSVISDSPLLEGGRTLIVPTWVPPGSGDCGSGTGWYDRLDLLAGGTPKTTLKLNGTTNLGAHYQVGPGPAFAPSPSAVDSGIGFTPGSRDEPAPAPGAGPRARLTLDVVSPHSGVAWRPLR